MQLLTSWLPLLAAAAIPLTLAAKDTSATSTTTTTNALFTLTGTITDHISDATLPTGSYLSYTSTLTLSTDSDGNVHSSMITGSESAVTAGNATSSGNSTIHTTPTATMTRLVGNNTVNATMTASASPSASPVVNTQPCNGHPEFCARKYSNITMVAAHNSPFIKPGNAAANQELGVISQLNDGIRMRTYS
jgi:hypothetical protein